MARGKQLAHASLQTLASVEQTPLQEASQWHDLCMVSSRDDSAQKAHDFRVRAPIFSISLRRFSFRVARTSWRAATRFSFRVAHAFLQKKRNTSWRVATRFSFRVAHAFLQKTRKSAFCQVPWKISVRCLYLADQLTPPAQLRRGHRLACSRASVFPCCALFAPAYGLPAPIVLEGACHGQPSPVDLVP